MLKSLKLYNFKMYNNSEFVFDKLTLISGDNGSGKTTLGLEAILFLLYGYVKKRKLEDLLSNITKEKYFWVEGEFEIENEKYLIKREYPTSLTIKYNDEFVSDPQIVIERLFGNREQFMKFKMIDSYTKEINFLEDTSSNIKRIFLINFDEYFTQIKNKLNNIKIEREKFNKDNLKVYNNHYCSEYRILVLKNNIEKYNKLKEVLYKEINSLNIKNNEVNKELSNIKSESKNYIEYLKSIKNKICYLCNQPVLRNEEYIKKYNNRIEENNCRRNILEESLKKIEEEINYYKQEVETIINKKEKLIILKTRLEEINSQKQYKYTSRDVLIIEQAIKKFDELTAYCLAEHLKKFIPIINSILSKIDFTIEFDYKGKDLKLNFYHKNLKYDYTDLSTGQKLILQIAIKIALLLEKGEYNSFLIADEGMSSVTNENLKYILSIFDNYPFQLILILHRFENIPDSLKVIDLDK